MRRLAETEDCIRELLGNEPLELFRAQIGDLICYTKALALSDMTSDANDVKEKLETICQRILAEVMGIFLSKNYSDDDGSVEINVDKRLVYDKDMNVIKPIKWFQEKHENIIKVMMSVMLPLFTSGRELAMRIAVKRTASIGTKSSKLKHKLLAKDTRDYQKYPPHELLSIEILRLERKLPNLSPEEGFRLSQLYQHT